MYKFLIVFIIFLDQFTKLLAQNVNILIRKNFGIALGLFPNSPLASAFTSLPFLAIIVAIYQTLKLRKFQIKNKEKVKLLKLSLTLLIAGSIANLIDKLYLGYVRDFIDIKIWPLFNIADIAIVLGLILYVYQIIQS